MIVPQYALLNKLALSAYIPVVRKYQEEEDEINRQKEKRLKQEKERHKPILWILDSKEFRSLIISALIFIAIFAWSDVLAIAYRDHIAPNNGNNQNGNNQNGNNQNDTRTAGFAIHIPHHIPENFASTIKDIDLRAKIGYATIISAISILLLVFFSINIWGDKVTSPKPDE